MQIQIIVLDDSLTEKVETWVKVEVDGVIGYTPEEGFLSQCGE